MGADLLDIIDRTPSHFTAKCNGWKIIAKWDGCVEFVSERGGNDAIHICEIEEFLGAVQAARDEMKRLQYEI